MTTLEDIVEREGIPCMVEHEDGLRYQVLGVDPFRTSYYYCKRVMRETGRPLDRDGEVWLWRYARGFTSISPGKGFISPEEQRARREKDRSERNAKQVRDLKRGKPTPAPAKPNPPREMGKVLPFRRKE